MSEEKKKDTTLLMNENSLGIKFASSIQIEKGLEIVIMNIIQEGPPHKDDKGQESKTVIFAGRYAFTWQHLERLKDLLDRAFIERNENNEEGSETH